MKYVDWHVQLLGKQLNKRVSNISIVAAIVAVVFSNWNRKLKKDFKSANIASCL